MVSFSCSKCGDVIKKPKVQSHAQQCGTGSFSCVDCMETFDLFAIVKHNSCLTEADRYQGSWRQRTNNLPAKGAAPRKNMDSDDEPEPRKKGGIARVKRPELTFSSSDSDSDADSKPAKKKAAAPVAKPVVSKAKNDSSDSDSDADSKPAKKKVASPASKPAVSKSNGLSPLLSPRRTTIVATGAKRSRSPKRPFTALPPPSVTTKREVAPDSESDIEETFELTEKIPLGSATLLGEIIDEIIAEQREINGVSKPKRSIIGQELALRYRKRIGNAMASAVSSLLDERKL